MLKTLIDTELQRLAKLGFDGVVSTEEYSFSGSDFTKSLGNDTFIITGIVVDEDSIQGDNERISIVSATDSITSNVSAFRDFGKSIHKVMRQYLDIHRSSSADGFGLMTVHGIKITPKFKN